MMGRAIKPKILFGLKRSQVVVCYKLAACHRGIDAGIFKTMLIVFQSFFTVKSYHMFSR